MRAAYLDDLRSKFLVENSVLKMEYAEVRVLQLAHKVWTTCASPGPSPLRHPSSWPGQLFFPVLGLPLRSSLSSLTTLLALPSVSGAFLAISFSDHWSRAISKA